MAEALPGFVHFDYCILPLRGDSHWMKASVVSTDVMTNNRSIQMQSSDGRDSPPQTEAWHMLSMDEAVERQQTDVARGLTQAEAARRLTQFGPNALA